MEFWLFIEDDRVVAATFTTDGCQHSIPAVARLVALAQEKSVEDVLALTQEDVMDVVEGIPKESQHCGLLAANTLKAAVEEYRIRTRRPQAAIGPTAIASVCEKTDCD